MSGIMLELMVGFSFALAVAAALVWVLVWLLRLRTTEVRGPRPGPGLSDEELARLLDSADESEPEQEH